jgi:hypothetical protein
MISLDIAAVALLSTIAVTLIIVAISYVPRRRQRFALVSFRKTSLKPKNASTDDEYVIIQKLIRHTPRQRQYEIPAYIKTSYTNHEAGRRDLISQTTGAESTPEAILISALDNYSKDGWTVASTLKHEDDNVEFLLKKEFGAWNRLGESIGFFGEYVFPSVIAFFLVGIAVDLAQRFAFDSSGPSAETWIGYFVTIFTMGFIFVALMALAFLAFAKIIAGLFKIIRGR